MITTAPLCVLLSLGVHFLPIPVSKVRGIFNNGVQASSLELRRTMTIAYIVLESSGYPATHNFKGGFPFLKLRTLLDKLWLWVEGSIPQSGILHVFK